MKTISSLILAILLTGCATPYGPRGIAGGYSHTQIQNDILTVQVNGNAYINKNLTEYYALVRAAELTIQKDRNYFRILAGDTDINTTHIYTPGQTYVNSNTYGNANTSGYAYPVGDTVYGSSSTAYSANTYTSAYSTPGYSSTQEKPTVTMTIQTLTSQHSPCLDARQVITGALAKGLKLEPATIAKYGTTTQ